MLDWQCKIWREVFLTNTGNDWPFRDPKNAAVFTTADIIAGRKPILYVSHDASDGAWQFHSGETVDISQAKTVALHLLAEIDPTIRDIADLPDGWIAERASETSEWRRYSLI